jgi:pectinesterase
VVYIDCWLGKHIRAEGWDNWRKADNEKTAYYAEYKSKGPGANPAGRVAWSHQLTDEDVKIYSTALIFGKTAGSVPFADNWLPAK